MQVLAEGRVRRTATEWRTVLEEFEASGLSALAFCRREQLSRSAFTRWRQQLAGKGHDEGTFVELPVRETEGLRTLERGELELALPGGVVLRWRP